MTIVLAGGSGFIGTRLAKTLLSLGHTVIVIDVRGPRFTDEHLFFIQCDLATQSLPYNVLERTDAVINLAGAPINKKWTPAYKEEIRMSRINSTRTIVEAIEHAQSKPSVFITASAIGYYGDTGSSAVDEQGTQGDGFLADVVAQWEAACQKASAFGVRTVMIRTAPVLGHGGMLAALLQTARFGFLLNLSRKDFVMSWIHEDDIVAVYLFALETTTLQGVVNAVAPQSIEHHAFMKALSHAVHRRVIGTIPQWIARRKFGQLFAEMTIDQQVTPQRLIDKGFTFAYPTIESALRSLFPKRHTR
jgi:uncharacterized protein (TIGR01777 family)